MTTLRFLPFFALCVLLSLSSSAAGSGDKAALRGVSSVKIYFDVFSETPQMLLTRFHLLNETCEQLEERGIKVEKVVIGFRAKATRLVTIGEKEHFDAEEEGKNKIRNWIRVFKELDFTLEQCAIAAEMQKIPKSDFLPEITVVTNGYISMIGYQAQGYSMVPME